MSEIPTPEQQPELEEPQAPLRERAAVFLVMALVLLLDQATKFIVEDTLPLYRSWAPFPDLAPLFQFTHATNTGAAFGLFPDSNTVFIVIAFIVSGVIVYYNHILPPNQKALRLALGLQLGGALGNMIDRIRLGHVTDFLDFGPWPVFNVADTAIVSGVVILGWLMLMEHRRETAAAKATEENTAVSSNQPIDDAG